jgi:hypothetical protein
LAEALSLGRRHRARCDREALAVRKLYHHAKQVPAGIRLTQDVIDRILSFGLGTLNKGSARADLLDLFRLNSMPGDVLDSIVLPDELMDSHAWILGETVKYSKAR